MWFPHLTVLQTGAQEVPSERQERFCAVQIDGALAQVTQRLWDLLLVDLQKPLECGRCTLLWMALLKWRVGWRTLPALAIL